MKNGFTLAEVLITLGIIGIVAAMTLPSLIQKQQKYVAANQLKVVYSILSNAIRMAEAQQGEAKYWQYYDQNLTTPQNTRLFTETYLIPYLKDIHVYNTYGLHGCKNIIYKNRDGEVMSCNSVIGFCENCGGGSPNLTHIHLANGAIMVPMTRNVAGDSGSLEIDVDINGYRGPNVWGRDVFRFYLNGQYTKYKLLGADAAFRTRSQNLQCCKEGTFWNCAAVVIEDGFKFSDDYPW